MLVGHAVLLLLWQARRLPPGSGDARPSLVLRLLSPPVEPERRRATAPAVLPTFRPVPPSVLPGLPVEDGAPPTGQGASGDTGMHTAAAPGIAASGPSTLDLRPSPDILRGALVNPATVDPRSNSPKPTFEERIAMGLDPTLCVKLERDPDGTVRRRMGRLGRAQSLLQSSHGAGAHGVLVCE